MLAVLGLSLATTLSPPIIALGAADFTHAVHTSKPAPTRSA